MTIALDSWVGADEREETVVENKHITQWSSKLQDAGFEQDSIDKLSAFLGQDNMTFGIAAEALDLFDLSEDGQINSEDGDQADNNFYEGLQNALAEIEEDKGLGSDETGIPDDGRVTLGAKDEDATDITQYVDDVDNLEVGDMENLDLNDHDINQFFKIDDVTYSIVNQDGVYRIYNEDEDSKLPERVLYNDDDKKDHENIGLWDVYATDGTDVIRVPDTGGRYKHYSLDSDGKIDQEVTVDSSGAIREESDI